jgi:hypothetical protein
MVRESLSWIRRLTDAVIDVRLWNHRASELCPILCPPPNPTKCDGVSLHRRKALLDKAFVAFHRNSSHSVQVVESSYDQSSGPGGRRFKSSLPDQSFQVVQLFRVSGWELWSTCLSTRTRRRYVAVGRCLRVPNVKSLGRVWWWAQNWAQLTEL